MSSDGKASSTAQRRSRRLRKYSPGGISVEELLPDDMAYDADVEVIRPDHYEEPESEPDETFVAQRQYHSVDDELAARMRQLGKEQQTSILASGAYTDRGRKRMSREIEGDAGIPDIRDSPDLEVHELVDAVDRPSPAKRRRKKSRRPVTTQHNLRNHVESTVGSSDRDVDAFEQQDAITSTTTATTSEAPTPKDDVEAMDTT